jgi:S-DNA-T family DNA segregation ATPase FtsK/SpoIIIE
MLGKGDMLYMAMGGSLIRIHGAYTSEDEIERVVKFVKSQARPNYVRHIAAEKPAADSTLSLIDKMAGKNSDDDLYARAVQIILKSDRPSISYLQRQLGIGYNKSANLIEKMQQGGLLSAPDSTGRRTVLKKKA